MQESAFLDPPWLLEREGAGYVQVTQLLYRVAEQCTGEHTVDEIAARIGEAGTPVSPITVQKLIAQLLIPRGLVEMGDGSVAPVAAGASSPLALNMRVKMISPEAVTPVTNVLRPLYWPPVMIAILLLAAATEVWLYAIHGIGTGLRDAIYTPGLMLIVLLVIVVSAAFHELGHAAALHYAGGRIKGMGAGIYIVYPAFFTDVSDNYRLPRWKRVRTDLGGFYFNLIFALAIMGLYAITGHEFLLLMVLMINLEIIHQLLPFVRLDGYWTLADITGVPDFFTQMMAFVRSVLPMKGLEGRKLPPLKTWAKVVFAAYMLVTIPLLILLVLLMLRSVPRVLATAGDSLSQQGQALMDAASRGDILGVLAPVGQSLLLLIPIVGLCYTLFSLGRRLTVGLWNWGKPSAVRRAVSGVCFLGAAALLGFMWVPQMPLPGRAPSEAPPTASYGPFSPVNWQPIGPEEHGTVQDVVSDAVMARPAATAEPTRGARATPQATPGAVVGDVQTRGTPGATSVATAAVPTVPAPVATAARAGATPTPASGAPASGAVTTATATPARATPSPTP